MAVEALALTELVEWPKAFEEQNGDVGVTEHD